MIKYKYGTNNYRFAEKLLNWFRYFEDIDSLTVLHKYINTDLYNKDTDQSSYFHKLFYKLPELSSFFLSYREFIINEIWERIYDKADILYQTKPTIRFHYVNNLSVGEFHKDSDYNHSEYEVNFFVPLTFAYNTNTIWCESKPGLADFKSLDAKYGEFWQFNGANCMHGNKINNTDITRVSFDFRVLKRKYYVDDNKESVTNNMKFKIGEYWSEI